MKTYYIKQRLNLGNDKYFIYDQKQQPILKVVKKGLTGLLDNFLGNIISLGTKIYIYNLDEAETIMIKKKKKFIWNQYDIFIDSSKYASLCEEKTWFKPNLSINTIDGAYKIKGNIFARDFFIVKDKEVMATIKKRRLTISDCYEISVFQEECYKLFIAITIAIDNLYHN
ncbi:hypothetical protein UT300005_33980 [Clostridium sp. CTA-5]